MYAFVRIITRSWYNLAIIADSWYVKLSTERTPIVNRTDGHIKYQWSFGGLSRGGSRTLQGVSVNTEGRHQHTIVKKLSEKSHELNQENFGPY